MLSCVEITWYKKRPALMLSYVILRTVVLSYTRRESRFFKLASIPSGRNVIKFEDKAL